MDIFEHRVFGLFQVSSKNRYKIKSGAFGTAAKQQRAAQGWGMGNDSKMSLASVLLSPDK